MKSMRIAITALALVTTASAAHAQTRFGVNASWGSDSDLGLGGRIEVGMPNMLSKTGPLSKAFFIGNIDYFFDSCSPASCTWLDINPGLAVSLGPDDKFYAGAGLNLARTTVDLGSFGKVSGSDTGLNLLGGWRFPIGSMSGFAEGRFNLGGGQQFVISGGILFGGSKTK